MLRVQFTAVNGQFETRFNTAMDEKYIFRGALKVERIPNVCKMDA
jgi:hypothetical protein